MTTFRPILSRLRESARTLLGLTNNFAQIELRINQLKINQGIMLSQINRAKRSLDIRDYELKAFSHWGEDGIIQHLESL